MTELKTHVERVVRPVRGRHGRKMRMRRELLAHLTAVYDEERAALGDDALALAQAVRRFGDPADLTRDLQATVPRVERWLLSEASGPFQRRVLDFEKACLDAVGLLTAPGGFTARRAVAVSARWTAVMLVAGLVFGSVAGALRAAALGVEMIQPAAGLMVGVGFCAYIFVATPLALGLVGAVAEGVRPRPLFRTVGFAVALLLASAAVVPAFNAVQPDNPLWGYLVETPERWLAAAGVFAGWVLLVPAVLRVSWYLEQPRREWAALQIEG